MATISTGNRLLTVITIVSSNCFTAKNKFLKMRFCCFEKIFLNTRKCANKFFYLSVVRKLMLIQEWAKAFEASITRMPPPT